METQSLVIRRATLKDLPSVTEIYNDAILTTTVTFDTQPKTSQEQIAWFEKHKEKFPIMVAEDGQKILGWASLSPWSDRCAYADTAENSVYVDKNARGRGIGRSLLKEIVSEGQRLGLHTIIARIAGESEASVRLHESVGFSKIGTMKEVGRKFGHLLDVHLYQLIFR